MTVRKGSKTIGALMAFGVIVLAAVVSARTQIWDRISDPIIDPGSASLTGVVDPFAGLFDPAAGPDLNDLRLDPSIFGVGTPGGVGLDPREAVSAVPTDPFAAISAAEQAWIDSLAGEDVDAAVNAIFVALFGRDLIGDGGKGATDDMGVGWPPR